jgi:hypothetical protein
LNLQAGRELRDAGIAQAVASAEELTPNWNETVYGYFLVWLALKEQGFEFLIEDFRVHISEIVPQPPSNRVYGAISVRAFKEGRIAKSGFRQVKNSKAHACSANLWKKV